MGDTTITFLVLGGAVVLFVWNQLPVEIVAIGATLTLWATGVLTLDEAFAGFGDSTVIFIASLFVVSEGLDATGVTTWAGQQMIAAQAGPHAAWPRDAAVAGVTALISVNGAVAALVPMVVVFAVRIRQPDLAAAHAARVRRPRRLAAGADGLAGERPHLGSGRRRGGRAFGFFEFTIVGVPLLIGTVAIVVLFGGACCRPGRRSIPPDLSARRMLADQYDLGRAADSLISRESGAAEVVVAPRSSMVGEVVFPGMITESGDLVILAVQRKGQDRGPGEIALAAGDALLVQGTWATSRSSSTTRTCWRSTRPSSSAGRVPLGPGGRGGRGARRDGGAAGDGSRPCGGGRAARRRGDGAAGRGHRRAGLPLDLVDDGGAGRRDDPALVGHAGDRRRGEARRRPDRRRRRLRPLRTPVGGRSLLTGVARPADQQHGDGADRGSRSRCRRRLELDVSGRPVLMA